MRILRLVLALVLGSQLALTPLPAVGAAPHSLGVAATRAACTVDPGGGGDYTTIQDAINDTTCDTITIAAGEYPESIVISRDVTLTGADAETTSIYYSEDTGRAVTIDDDDVEVTISDITLQAVYNNESGGCIYSEGDLTLERVTVKGCMSGSYGGGIYARGDLSVISCVVTGNQAAEGGGIYYLRGSLRDSLTVVDSTIEQNIAAEAGGGMLVSSGEGTIEASLIQENYADERGGGLYNGIYATLTISDSAVLTNTASTIIDSGYGGGIYNGGVITLSNTLVQGNSSAFEGGGIFGGSGSNTWLDQSQVRDNTAGFYGGGIMAYSVGSPKPTTTLTASDVSDNTADTGGGIVNMGALTLENSSVTGNTAEDSGGGIRSDGTLAVTGGTVSDNSAGAHGGGLYSEDESLVLTEVLLEGNVASSDGGGIYAMALTSDTHADLTQVTLATNQAGGAGGGIYQSTYMSMTNSTLSGNSAGGNGGGIANYGPLTLHSVTLADNTADSDGNGSGDGGGIWQYSSHQPGVTNSLIGGNSDNSTGTVHPDCSGTYTSYGYNLIRDATGCSGFVTVYDQTGTAGTPLEPYLLPLGDYGGATPTHAPRYSTRYQSPAVDAGTTTSCPATDQRGVARPIDRDGDGTAECDIGAVELELEAGDADLAITQSASAATVAPGEQLAITLTFTNTGPYEATSIVVSDALPALLTYNGAVGSGVVITPVTGSSYAWQVSDMAAGDAGSITIQVTVASGATGGASITNPASIAGAEDDPVTGNNSSSGTLTVGKCFATPDDGATVFRSLDAEALREAIDAAAANATVKVAGTCTGVGGGDAVAEPAVDLTLRGGYTAGEWSTPDPDHPAILDAEGGGHAVSVKSVDVTLEYLRLTGGQETYGGGLYINGSVTELSGVEIVGNAADYSGGGIYATDSTVTLHETQLLSNTAYSGAGIYGGNVSTLLFDTVTVAHNATDSNGVGGGICLSSGAATLTDTLITANSADFSAGGLYVGTDGTATVRGGSISNNSAYQDGGGLYTRGQTMLEEVTVDGNTAIDSGGIYASAGALSLSQVTLSNNSASGGLGGALNNAGAAVTLERCAVVNNTATAYGGGIYNNGGTLSLSNVTLSGNETDDCGGALYNKTGATATLTFTTIAGNTASYGGGIYGAAQPTLANTLLAGNTPDNCHGYAPLSSGYNLADDASCSLTGTGDQDDAEAQIGSLQNNGGDTFTHALLATSPAVNAGLCVAGITTDQRGSPRPGPSSTLCDIGAYESPTSAAPADVTLSKSATPAAPAPGAAITYTLAYTNTGGLVATGVRITDTLPASVLGTSYSSSGASLTPVSGNRYVWRVANLAPGSGGVITISGVVAEPQPAGVIANTATIAARNDTATGNNSDTANVTVPNSAPVATNATAAALDESAVRHSRVTATDPNGDALNYGLAVAPIWGTVTLEVDGTFVYTPSNRTTDYTDTFTYVVTDTGGLSDGATLSIPVTADNDPPGITNIPNQHTSVGVAVGPLPFTIGDPDTPLPGLTLGKASDNTTLVPPANIVLGGAGSGRNVTVTPVTGLSGVANITISVSDGPNTTTESFALAVGAVNNPPEFTSTPVLAATEDSAYTYSVVTNDLDSGETLTITAVSKPAWLTLVDHHNRRATLGGTPRNGDVGAHGVTLQVVDPNGASATQSFTVTVANTNDAPVAHPDTAATSEATPKTITVMANDSDPDGDTLSVTGLGMPTYGSAALIGETALYTPANRTATYAAVFTYTLSDGALEATGRVTVTVNAPNDPPVISDIPDQETPQNTPTGPLTFTLSDGDSPLATLSLSRATSNPALTPLAGIVFGGSGADRTVTVTPTTGLAGTAFITITVSDGTSTDSDGFRLDVLPNTLPLFVSVPLTVTQEDLPYEYTIYATDAEDGGVPGALTYSALLKPAWLTFTDNGDNTAMLSGTPAQAHVGEHSIRLRVTDTDGGFAIQEFTLTVLAVNDRPIARPDSAATDESTPILIVVLSNDSDPDGDALTLDGVTTPLYGQAVISGSAVLYLPVQRTTNFVDTFRYALTDGALSASAAVTVTVTASDDPPTISDIHNLRTDSGTPVGPVPFRIKDPDTPVATLVLGKASSNPALLPTSAITFGGSGIVRTLTLTPTAAIAGTAIVTITVSDATSTAADSFILAVATNTPPEFISIPPVDALEGQLYAYLALATDVDPGEVLTITAPVLPAWLTLTPLSNGRAVVQGIPPEAAVGAHPIELQVRDRDGATATQAYTLTVQARNQRPIADAGPDQNVTLGALVTLDGSGSSDPDVGDMLTYGWRQLTGPAVTLSNAAAQKPTFTAPGTATTLTFALVVTDSLGLVSLPDTVSIGVGGAVNQAPTAAAGPDQTVNVGALVLLSGAGSSDPDGNLPLTYLWQQTSGTTVTLSNPAGVAPTFTAPGTATVLTFSLTVTDSLGLASTPDTVTITVQAYQIYLPLVLRQTSGG
ncbi:MAG: tandem-95 repeat protein [Anaerolineae bacterium]|nr:tandem-95 repeat protein [Anaerolineae bacterium]